MASSFEFPPLIAPPVSRSLGRSIDLTNMQGDMRALILGLADTRNFLRNLMGPEEREEFAKAKSHIQTLLVLNALHRMKLDGKGDDFVALMLEAALRELRAPGRG